MDFIAEIIVGFIFELLLSNLYKILQYIGMVIRLILTLGNKTPEYLLQQEERNTFVALFVLAAGIALGCL